MVSPGMESIMELEPTYPEQLAKRILARAIDVDRVRGDYYSLAELRSIAAEAGVREVALDQALRELQPRPVGSGRAQLNRYAVAGVRRRGHDAGGDHRCG
jgi:hypothetical protein